MPRSQSLAFAVRRRSHALLASRLPSIAVNFFGQTPRIRSFTQNPPFLLVSRSNPRVQLPFLHSTCRAHVSKSSFRTQLARYISTERKRKWREQFKWQVRFHAYFWPTISLLAVIYTGLRQSKYEQKHPTPHEWTFWSRWCSRTARWTEYDPEAKITRVITDWKHAAAHYEVLLERLEDPNIDGQHLIEQGDGGIFVEGVGKTGYDIGAKSEPWRRGYYEALVGMARCAEHLDGIAKRKGQPLAKAKLYPWDSIPGPRNPKPKPLPWDKDGDHLSPPQEFECEDACAAPEVYYMKILTTKGFNTRQRLDAALGYADWCDFKELNETAGSMYDWAMDIAAGALPEGADNVVNLKTGVINSGKDEFVSENVLKATTALAVHHAKNGEVKEALPIFLSILRSRKSLPALPVELQRKAFRSSDDSEDDAFLSWVSAAKNLIIERPYPKAPESGDERPWHNLNEACEEIGIMTYIGEILFATSEQEREKGLSWTRDSVEAAEAVLWFMDEKKDETNIEGRQKCRQCLETGLLNWKQMARQMANMARKKQDEAQRWQGRFGLGFGKDAALQKAMEEVERWNEEEVQIELRRQKTASLVNPLTPSGGLMI